MMRVSFSEASHPELLERRRLDRLEKILHPTHQQVVPQHQLPEKASSVAGPLPQLHLAAGPVNKLTCSLLLFR